MEWVWNLFSSNHYKNRHSAFQNSWGNKLTILDDVWILLGMYMLRKAIFIWKWKTRWNAHPRIQKVCVVDYKFRLQLFFAQFINRNCQNLYRFREVESIFKKRFSQISIPMYTRTRDVHVKRWHEFDNFYFSRMGCMPFCCT